MANKKKKRIFQTLGTIVASAAAGGGITAGFTLNIGNENNETHTHGIPTDMFIKEIDKLYDDVFDARQNCYNDDKINEDILKLTELEELREEI